jgi:hypothetical protein
VITAPLTSIPISNSPFLRLSLICQRVEGPRACAVTVLFVWDTRKKKGRARDDDR